MQKNTWTARLARIYGHQEESSPVINLPIVNVDGPYLLFNIIIIIIIIIKK